MMTPDEERPSATAAMLDIPERKNAWWSKGVQFECQGSGKCCVSHGEFGYVYMTLKDRQRMAKHLKLATASFTQKYCSKSDGFFHLKQVDHPECMFLKDKKCTVYEGRPTQCRTWPFWPEVMSAKAWRNDVSRFCPGVGKGRIWSADEIERILREQAGTDIER